MASSLREPTFLMLTALTTGRLHGYGIITEVDQISGGLVRLRAGTLYEALDRLVASGHISPDGDEVIDGRLRRYYVLTGAGAEVLRQEADRMSRMAAEATRRLRTVVSSPRVAGGPA